MLCGSWRCLVHHFNFKWKWTNEILLNSLKDHIQKPHSHSINDSSITCVANQNEKERDEKINKSKVCRIFSQQPQKQYTKSDVVVTNNNNKSRRRKRRNSRRYLSPKEARKKAKQIFGIKANDKCICALTFYESSMSLCHINSIYILVISLSGLMYSLVFASFFISIGEFFYFHKTALVVIRIFIYKYLVCGWCRKDFHSLTAHRPKCIIWDFRIFFGYIGSFGRWGFYPWFCHLVRFFHHHHLLLLVLALLFIEIKWNGWVTELVYVSIWLIHELASHRQVLNNVFIVMVELSFKMLKNKFLFE